MLSQTDLRLQYTLTLGGARRLVLGLNVLNLFDQGRGISKFAPENDTPGGPDVVIDSAAFYAGQVNVGALFDEQQVPRDPRFLQFAEFQAPIRARIDVRFSF